MSNRQFRLIEIPKLAGVIKFSMSFEYSEKDDSLYPIYEGNSLFKIINGNFPSWAWGENSIMEITMCQLVPTYCLIQSFYKFINSWIPALH